MLWRKIKETKGRDHTDGGGVDREERVYFGSEVLHGDSGAEIEWGEGISQAGEKASVKTLQGKGLQVVTEGQGGQCGLASWMRSASCLGLMLQGPAAMGHAWPSELCLSQQLCCSHWYKHRCACAAEIYCRPTTYSLPRTIQLTDNIIVLLHTGHLSR